MDPNCIVDDNYVKKRALSVVQKLEHLRGRYHESECITGTILQQLQKELDSDNGILIFSRDEVKCALKKQLEVHSGENNI